MIEFEKVVVRFGRATVLNGVSFSLPADKISYIIGASGSGKSTILRVMMGFIRPKSGKVIIDGEDVTAYPERRYAKIRRKMGMVFQGSALFDSMNVMDNVAFYPMYREKKKPREYIPQVLEILEQVGLKGTEKLYPSELSGGMRRRVALARALIYKPKVLLYDEPTTGLDPITSELVNGIIDEMNRKFNVTSVVVSHDISSVLSIANHIIFLDKGQSIELGGHDSVLECDHPAVLEFTRSIRVMAKKVTTAFEEVS
ncbi:ATP-binding cassette domain-containing protein [bacterium]|nr:ATP-binding cassette domain-containing protein [bacterium]